MQICRPPPRINNVNKRQFPIFDDAKLPKVPHLAYWYWDLRPALPGIAKMDANDRFRAHFLLSITDDDHIPFYLASFVHRDLYRMVRRRTDLSVELDDVGFTIKAGLICGYIRLYPVADWLAPVHLRLDAVNLQPLAH